MKKTHIFFVTLMTIISTNQAWADSAELIQKLRADLPAGVFYGKSNSQPCTVTVSHSENRFQLSIEVSLLEGRSSSKGDFVIQTNSQLHPRFPNENRVGHNEGQLRTLVAVASNDVQDGYRLVIQQKDMEWALRAGTLRGAEATCVISTASLK